MLDKTPTIFGGAKIFLISFTVPELRLKQTLYDATDWRHSPERVKTGSDMLRYVGTNVQYFFLSKLVVEAVLKLYASS